MNNVTRAIVLAALAVTFAACKNVAPDVDQAAVIVNPDAAKPSAADAAMDGGRMTLAVESYKKGPENGGASAEKGKSGFTIKAK